MKRVKTTSFLHLPHDCLLKILKFCDKGLAISRVAYVNKWFYRFVMDSHKILKFGCYQCAFDLVKNVITRPIFKEVLGWNELKSDDLKRRGIQLQNFSNMRIIHGLTDRNVNTMFMFIDAFRKNNYAKIREIRQITIKEKNDRIKEATTKSCDTWLFGITDMNMSGDVDIESTPKKIEERSKEWLLNDFSIEDIDLDWRRKMVKKEVDKATKKEEDYFKIKMGILDKFEKGLRELGNNISKDGDGLVVEKPKILFTWSTTIRQIILCDSHASSCNDCRRWTSKDNECCVHKGQYLCEECVKHCSYCDYGKSLCSGKVIKFCLDNVFDMCIPCAEKTKAHLHAELLKKSSQ